MAPRPAVSAFAMYHKKAIKKEFRMKIKPIKRKKRPTRHPDVKLKLQQLKKHPCKVKLMSESAPNCSNVKTSQVTDNGTKSKRQPKVFEILEHLPDDVKLLQWMLAPVELHNFFKIYWEIKPLHINRKNMMYYKHILNSKILDKIIRENSLFYTRNIDIVSYEDGKRETHNPEGRAVSSAVWDYYQNGCSIRILNPQTYCQKIQLLLSTLQEYFGTMVGANVYLTPPGSQGFAPHYDDIEAFVLQLEGRKHWKLYSPKDANEFLARESSKNFSRDDLGELIQEVTLEAGSLLYFPRGTVHEACTDADAHSLHLTVSVYQRTSYADLLEGLLPTALRDAARNNVAFRRGLPLNYLRETGVVNKSKPSELRKEIFNTVVNLVDSLINYADIDAAVDQLGRKFMYDAVPPVLSKEEKMCSVKGDGEYLIHGKVYNRIQFCPDTKVRLLRYHCIRLVIEDGHPRIYYCTENSKVYHEEDEQFLEIDMSLVQIITHLQQTFPQFISVENLPADDSILKMQVISDLWERGVLITEEPLERIEDEED